MQRYYHGWYLEMFAKHAQVYIHHNLIDSDKPVIYIKNYFQPINDIFDSVQRCFKCHHLFSFQNSNTARIHLVKVDLW
jgi:hypothetical protein